MIILSTNKHAYYKLSRERFLYISFIRIKELDLFCSLYLVGFMLLSKNANAKNIVITGGNSGIGL
jgi:hypothetical protein